MVRSFEQRYAVRTDRGSLFGRYYDLRTAEAYARDANRRAAGMGLCATRYQVIDLGDPNNYGRFLDTADT
jgi:hypothetical protein